MTTAISAHITLLQQVDLASYQPDEAYYYWRSIWEENPDCSNQRDVLHERIEKLFVIRMHFRNMTSAPVERPFSNTQRKLELLGLKIVDDFEERVLPERTFYARVRPGSKLSLAIPPGEVWDYDLVGEWQNTQLVFPGAKYSLLSRRRYSLSIEVKNLSSNIVSFTSPEVAQG